MFRRHRDEPEMSAAPGREACLEPGCARRDGGRCAYVDKRGRRCPSTWCSQHARLVDGVLYCRRHASTLLALGREENVAGLPDLENRAPSLVGHVGDDLDGFVRELFARHAPPACSIVTDPVRLVLTPGGRTRRWAKTWKLADHRGVVNRVSIEVDEADDPRVAARVDTELIGSGVPPWIEHRRNGERVDAVTAERERRGFAASMARSIELVLTHQEALPRY